MVKYCGEIGVMGDLGMHALHLPLRLGFKPFSVYANLQDIVKERPDKDGIMVPCETWDNAILHTMVKNNTQEVPMTIEMKRIAPSETNTWYIEILGTKGGIRFSTKEPKTLWTFVMEGSSQKWQKEDLGFKSVLDTITGGIFEPGFPDCFMQMLGAYFTEREGRLKNKFHCATPNEALYSHKLFHAALISQRDKKVVKI